MRGSTKRFVSIIMALLILVAAVFVYSSFIRPAYSDIKVLRGEVAFKTNTFNQQQASSKQIQSLLSQSQDVLKVEDTISSILPLSSNVASGVNQISGLSKINNLNLDVLSVEEAATRPSDEPDLVKGVGVMRFNFHVVGSYENFKSFLNEVETNISLMDLVNLKIEPTTKARSGENRFSYTLTLNTYYQAQ